MPNLSAYLNLEQETSAFRYYTNISVGTPPQEFRALIDLNWNTLIIPSIKCFETSEVCRSNRLLYNSSASNTSKVGNSRRSLNPDWTYLGNITLDLVQIGPFTIEEHKFLEAEWISEWGFYLDYDAVLGFAPFSGKGPSSIREREPSRSPFQTLVQSGKLKENLFAIKFPKPPFHWLTDQSDAAGELLIGEIDEKYKNATFDEVELSPNSTKLGIWMAESESFV
jgi:saccharopepsin